MGCVGGGEAAIWCGVDEWEEGGIVEPAFYTLQNGMDCMTAHSKGYSEIRPEAHIIRSSSAIYLLTVRTCAFAMMLIFQ